MHERYLQRAHNFCTLSIKALLWYTPAGWWQRECVGLLTYCWWTESMHRWIILWQRCTLSSFGPWLKWFGWPRRDTPQGVKRTGAVGCSDNPRGHALHDQMIRRSGMGKYCLKKKRHNWEWNYYIYYINHTASRVIANMFPIYSKAKAQILKREPNGPGPIVMQIILDGAEFRVACGTIAWRKQCINFSTYHTKTYNTIFHVYRVYPNIS